MKLSFGPNKFLVFLPRRVYKGSHERRSVVLIHLDCDESERLHIPVYIIAEAQCSEVDNFSLKRGRAIALSRIESQLKDRQASIRGVYSVKHNELFDPEGEFRYKRITTPLSYLPFPPGLVGRFDDLLCEQHG